MWGLFPITLEFTMTRTLRCACIITPLAHVGRFWFPPTAVTVTTKRRLVRPAA